MAARGVSAALRRLLEQRRLLKADLGEEAIAKELDGATYDLQRSKTSLAESDFKWATIKGYYSMFHGARALLYAAGYRERSHAALLTALRELYVKPGTLAEDLLGDFENAMSLREEADYAMNFSEDGSRRVVGDAGRFLQAAKESLKAMRQTKDSDKRAENGND